MEQCVFYDRGVGTGRFDRLLGGAFGWGITRKILDAYLFLVRTYQPGDELFLVGFSRGAYTVRSTFGFIRNCGLLKPQFSYKINDAYSLYRRRDDASHPDAVESELFRTSYSWNIRAKFMGVWDTVGALGLPVGGSLRLMNKRWAFHDMTLSSWVDNAFQALAIDEHRKPFVPSVWEKSTKSNGQVLEQVWFAGVHSNVGGSYPQSELSDITLTWMIDRAQGCGLEIDRNTLANLYKVRPDPCGKLYNSQTFWYKVTGLGDFVRSIGQKPGEAVADKAVFRANTCACSYNPANLANSLKAGIKVIPV